MTATKFSIEALVAEVNEILVLNAGLSPADVVADGTASLEELGLDSLAAMELQSVLESRHGVTIPDDAVGLTVRDIAITVRDDLSTAEAA